MIWATKLCLGAGIVVSLLLMSGCVMPDKVNEVQKDLADIRADLKRVQENQDKAMNRLQDLEATAADPSDLATKTDLADVTVGIDQLSRDVAIVDERLNDMGQRMDRLTQQVQQAREMTRSGTYAGAMPSGGPGADDARYGGGTAAGAAALGGAAAGAAAASSGGDALPDPDELYNTAYADFSKGNYALAVSGFEEYQEKFPATAQADNALYWVGECHYSQGDFVEAVKAFDRLLELYPRSDKAAASNLKKGLAYLEQNDVGRAIVQLRFVVAEFPGSDEAKIAKDKLTSLGASS